MATNSKIEWTRHTANLWWGCTEVHPGCDHCYARLWAASRGKPVWGPQTPRIAIKSIWADLLKWQREAVEAGEVHNVFCGSMMDIFEKSMPVIDWQGHVMSATTGELRERYFRDIIPATPNLLHLLLTKRPSNIGRMVPPEWLQAWPANVMTGTSPVDHETAVVLIRQLLAVPGPHFLSVEPLLSAVDFYAVSGAWPRDGHPWLNGPILGGIDWVIVGGESGPGARPLDVAWVRRIVAQCRQVGTPVFVKQLGARPCQSPEHDGATGYMFALRDAKGGDPTEWPEDLRIREFPTLIRTSDRP